MLTVAIRRVVVEQQNMYVFNYILTNIKMYLNKTVKTAKDVLKYFLFRNQIEIITKQIIVSIWFKINNFISISLYKGRFTNALFKWVHFLFKSFHVLNRHYII